MLENLHIISQSGCFCRGEIKQKSLLSTTTPSFIENLGVGIHLEKKEYTGFLPQKKPMKVASSWLYERSCLLHDKKTPHERGKAFEVKKVRECWAYPVRLRLLVKALTWVLKSTMLAPHEDRISEVLNASLDGAEPSNAMTHKWLPALTQTFQNALDEEWLLWEMINND